MTTTHPSAHRTRSLATGLCAASVAGALVAVVAGAASGLTWPGLVDLFVVTNVVIGLALAGAGWPIAAHRPRNPIGWCLLAGGCCYVATAAGTTVVAYAAGEGWQGAAWRVVATIANGSWAWALALCIPLGLLLFPDGRLPGRRWSWLVPLMVCDAVLLWATAVLSPRGLADEVGVSAYLSWSGYARIAGIEPVAGIGLLVGYAGALLALAVRYRRGSDQTRRQLLWVVLALAVVLAGFALDAVLRLESLLPIVSIALLPTSISVAVLRHQLLDIRLVVSRSVLYVLLTAGVVAVYLGAVTVLDQVLRRQVPLGSSVLATLLIAVAFNPVRVWLQRHVDHLLYGARQDPVRVVAEVGARLGDAATPAGAGLAGVLGAVCETMRFPYAALLVADTQIASSGEPVPLRHSVPLRPDDEQWGDLVVGLRPGESRLSPSDARVLALLAAPLAVAVQAGALADEVGRSRERIISAREEERRRLRRDLHDGLGPILTGVVLNAEAARTLIASDPRRSAALLARLRDQTVGAVEDIRRLVDDLRPPALDGLGLLGALRERATALSRRADGTPVRVDFEVPEALDELPAAVEVAVYRIVTEALTNVARHADASFVRVTIRTDDRALHVSVRDDGAAIAVGWRPGVGLTSIRERATELGGRCELRADDGFGIEVLLPLSVVEAVGTGASAGHVGDSGKDVEVPA